MGKSQRSLEAELEKVCFELMSESFRIKDRLVTTFRILSRAKNPGAVLEGPIEDLKKALDEVEKVLTHPIIKEQRKWAKRQ